MKILVVSPEFKVLQLISTVLGSKGFEVYMALDEVEVEELKKEMSFDFTIRDNKE